MQGSQLTWRCTRPRERRRFSCIAMVCARRKSVQVVWAACELGRSPPSRPTWNRVFVSGSCSYRRHDPCCSSAHGVGLGITRTTCAGLTLTSPTRAQGLGVQGSPSSSLLCLPAVCRFSLVPVLGRLACGEHVAGADRCASVGERRRFSWLY